MIELFPVWHTTISKSYRIACICKYRLVGTIYAFTFAGMRPRQLLTLILMLYLPARSVAQDTPPLLGYGLEVNPFAGNVIKHTPKFHLPLPQLSTGLDMNFIYRSYGKKAWQQRRRYPTLGIGITYTNYGIDSVYGRCIGIYPNLTIPLITGKKLEWTLRSGDGIGYVTKTYGRRPISDTLNNAIGSHINDYASFNTDVRYHVNKKWDVQLGFNFSHISDASYHQPNLGINLYGGHVGIRYFPVTSAPERIHLNLKPLSNRWLMQAKVSIAFNQLEAPGGPLYPVYLASVYTSKRWLSKNKMLIGLDYSYHTGIYAFQRNNEANPGNEAANSYKLGLFAANEFLIGRLGVILEMGYYLKQAHLKQDIYYEKIGGNYYLVQREKGPIKEFFLTGLLKTHKTVAELAEFGFGFGF